MLGRACEAVVVGLLALVAWSSPAGAATPPSGTLTANSQGQGNTLTWTGSVHIGSETGSQDEGIGCFGSDNKPADPTTTGCDIFTVDVSAASDLYNHFTGGPSFKIANFGGSAPDLDMYIYRRNADGTADLSQPAGSAATEADPEQTTISRGSGGYYIVVVPFATGPTQTYDGEAKFVLKPRLSIAEVNALAPEGQVNYRASHDARLSHSEPTIAMDPLNHNHLMAGSKQYDNLGEYLFKIGTYESFDGGRTWTDHDQLPGYCGTPSECDPNQPTKYRVVSDISQVFDDEGNAYSFVLDSPGGTSSTSGWGMNLHIKQPGKPWSGPIVVHSNSANPLTDVLFLDDKNWLAIDNAHTPTGGPNRPRDGVVGPLYTCWSLDQGSSTPVPGVGQNVVFMRSADGGHTWGGIAPGDNTPIPLSQKGAVSGLGCHIIVGPQGEVYVTWYDPQLDAIMQVKSTDFGHTFTPARPIATITGQNTSFPGQAFRNLSIPTTGVDSHGNVYVAVDSDNGSGAPVIGSAARAAQDLIEKGQLDKEKLRELVRESGEQFEPEREQGGDGPPTCPSQDTTTAACTDVILFKSTDGGNTYSAPVRVNQDDPKQAADQFQPWMAITPKGQLDISYFDRRNDPNNFYIDTYLSRSNDGGKTFVDTRVTHSVWDPDINPPTSPSGAFIGDYQGIVADDNAAIPFWNDTQYANLPTTDPEYSPYQEVSAARVSNVPAFGGPSSGPLACGAQLALKSVGAKPRGHGVRVQFQRTVDKRATARIFRLTRGRRLIQARRVASFRNLRGTFTWNGRANVRHRHVGDGYYDVRIRVPVGRTFEQRQVAVVRRHGRFHARPQYVTRRTCAALTVVGLNRPVFGGSNNRRLGIYYRLHRTMSVNLTLMRGKHVVRRLRAKRQSSGGYKLHVSSRRLRRGNYTVRMIAKRGKTTRTVKLAAARL